MNLFVLDNDPALAAQGLDDKRVGKLLIEAAQMLSTAVWAGGYTGTTVGRGGICLPAYQRHPVTLWVGATRLNWQWAMQHAYALAHEFSFRFGKCHATEDRLPYIATLSNCIPDGPLLPFQNSARNQGVGVDYSHLPVPDAYRVYIQERWKHDTRPVTFTNREWPQWVELTP